jgi:hypothetical protein
MRTGRRNLGGGKNRGIESSQTGLKRERNEIAPIVVAPRKPSIELAKKPPFEPPKGPSTGIRSALRAPVIHELLGKKFKYTPINLTVYTAAYSGIISGLVGSSRWLEDSVSTDYDGFACIAGAFAMAFDLAWEENPNTNPPDTLQVFVIEKTCKAVWESRDVAANASSTNSDTFAVVSQSIIAVVLASESYFASQGITPAVWPSGGGGGGVTEVLAGTGIAVSGPTDTPTVNNTGILAVDPGTGIGVSTVSGVATITNEGLLSAVSGTGIDATTLAGVLTIALEGVRSPWTIENFYVDPSNSTGHASDSNDGLTSSTPILTTAELNMRLFLHDIQVNAIITYLSDDLGYVQFDPSTISIGLGAPGSLTFQGTQQILHTGGTIDAGTIAINPAAAGGGQRQVVHTSDLTTFLPYVIDALGGTADNPTYIRDSATDDSAWIVSATAPASPSMSRPAGPDNESAGSITIGDGYTVARGSILGIAQSSVVTGNGLSSIVFIDFAFTAESIVAIGSTCFRCSFLNTITYGVTLQNCFCANGIQNEYGSILLNGGVLLTTENDFCITETQFGSDLYIASSETNSGIIISPVDYAAIFVDPGYGAGIQVQDAAGPGIEISGTALLGSPYFGGALVWGNGNGLGILIDPNGAGLVWNFAPNIPSITGLTGDFGFTPQSGTGVLFVARPFDETTGVYGPSSATTWANFANPSIFNFQAHSVSTNASLIGSQ